jgi:hypothetical protein
MRRVRGAHLRRKSLRARLGALLLAPMRPFRKHSSVVTPRAYGTEWACRASCISHDGNGVEHPFRVVKRQFGHVKARYRGLTVGAGAGIDAQAMRSASSANIPAADHIRRAAHSVLRRFMMGFKEALRC